MTVQEAKEIDIADYLLAIGHTPVKKSGSNFWYISPLHNEKTGSFKVNRALNRWYDFSEGKGGNLIDFGVLYYKCSVAELLLKLRSPTNPIKSQPKTTKSNSGAEGFVTNALKIISVNAITSLPLIHYLHSREIPLVVAVKYLREIRYKTGDRIYYALGFKNDGGGYELRSRNFKGSSSPKTITFLENGSKKLKVFEGFFNFLSYMVMTEIKEPLKNNFLILNSVSFFEKAIPEMLKYAEVDLYLDNDKTGERLTRKALGINSGIFSDKRSLYTGYNDLNEMHIKTSADRKHPPGPT